MSASKEIIETIKKLLTNGNFCHSAIELNSHYDDFVSGEKIYQTLNECIELYEYDVRRIMNSAYMLGEKHGRTGTGFYVGIENDNELEQLIEKEVDCVSK